MGLRALIRNGMGDSDMGTGAEEDDFLYFSNYYLLQEGYVNSGDFAVSQRGAGANMSVDVAKGKLFIPNSSWLDNTDGETKYWAALNDAVANLTVTANSSGNPRIDIVIVTLNTATAPDDEATNVVELSVVAGTPAGSPVAPTTPANSYKLAEIAVANGAVSVVTANITDTRDYAYLNLNKGALAYGEGLHFLDSAGDPTTYFYMKATDHIALHIGTATKSFVAENSAGTNVFEINTDTNYVAGLEGYSLRAYSAGNDKSVEIYHNDSDGIINVTSGVLSLAGSSIYHVGSIFPNANNTYDAGSVATHWNNVYGQNAYTTVSDQREKEEIEATTLGLDFINALQPKQWKWKSNVTTVPVRDEDGNVCKNEDGEAIMEDVIRQHTRKHHGFVAQDIETLLTELNISTNDFGGFIKDETTGKYALRYGEFMAPMIKAIQELSAKVDALEK